MHGFVRCFASLTACLFEDMGEDFLLHISFFKGNNSLYIAKYRYI